MAKPVVAFTVGDPSGVGPEVTVKALSQSEEIYRLCSPVVVADARVISASLKWTKGNTVVRSISDVSEASGKFGVIDVLDNRSIDPSTFEMGKIQAVCGKAAMQCLEDVTKLALDHRIAAMCNGPLNKEATVKAGFEGLGHLEYLAKASGSKEYATMLATGTLRVIHLTTHYSLSKACTLVTRKRILSKLRLTHKSFIDWGFPKARIAVAALNPHGGEDGMFGREEIDEISPAVKDAQAEGINAIGPIPADTVFTRAIKGEFDCVLAMFHDQGHIPIKVHGFEKSVSVALGLPFIRTAVDHGTAHDIAGKGVADHQGMVEAAKTAALLASQASLRAKL